MYIYIYIYIWVMSYPPLLFDHPATYTTSWRAGETIALVYNYTTTHTITYVYCRRETLGIICPTSQHSAKNRWASVFQLFQLFQHSAKNRWASFFQLFQLFQLFQHSAKNRLGTNILFKMLEKLKS